MNAAVVLFADRMVALSNAGHQACTASLSGMVSAAKQAGADAVSLWVLCPSETVEKDCQDFVLHEAEKLGADVLFALCPAFFETPTVRSAKAVKPFLTLIDAEKPELLLFEDGIRARELALRAALSKNAACMTEVRGFSRQNGRLVLRRSAYNANLTAELELPLPNADRCGVFTVIPADFPPVSPQSVPEAFTPKVRTAHLPCDADSAEADNAILLPAKAESGIKSAKRVVVCGHGMEKAEHVQAARELAQALGASLGGTRPAVIDGWIDHSQLVGISGTFIKPELCLVLGASGARAFAAGVRESGLMIAVNTDEKAPIFRMSDAGAVCDCVSFAKELTMLVQQHEKKGS
jgi:electron transfer flavoprotein alpha subunit